MDSDVLATLKILIIGESGVGKSRLIVVNCVNCRKVNYSNRSLLGFLRIKQISTYHNIKLTFGEQTHQSLELCLTVFLYYNACSV